MKKILLSALCVFGLGMMANAHEVSVTFKELGYDNAQAITTLSLNNDIALTFDKGTGSTAPAYYNTGSAARLYGGNTLEIAGVQGVTISNVVFTHATGDNGWSESETVYPGTVVTDGNTTTWTGSANSFVVSNTATKGHVRITSITVTYTGGSGSGEVVVPEDPKFGYVKTMTPGKKYVLYCNGNIGALITGNYGYMKGESVELDNNQIQTKETNAIEFEAGEDGYYIKNSQGKYYYMTGDYNSFNVSSNKEETGQWVVSFEGGFAKIVNTSNEKYIQFSPNYSNFGAYATESGVLPLLFELGAAGENVPDAPVVVVPAAKPTFSAASGDVLAGTVVEIKCATEGAVIYYTINGSDPTTTSSVYSTPIVVNSAMTIKAMAVAPGYEPSDIAEANYTIKQATVVASNQAIFEWAVPYVLNPVQEVPDAANNEGKGIEVEGITFSNNGVTLVANQGEASTPARLWNNKGAIELRAYNKSTITIAASSNIKSIEFFGGAVSTKVLSYNGVFGSLEDGQKVCTWTATSDTKSVMFDLIGTINCSHVIVTLEGGAAPTVVGDVSGDGEVSITDVVMACNYVLADQYFAAADLNHDGELSVTDIVAIVNIILSEEAAKAPAKVKAYAETAETGALYINDFNVTAGESKVVEVNVDTPDYDITAFQFDIALPAGLTVGVDEDDDYEFALTSRKKSSHNLSSRAQSNRIRVVCYSSKSANFSGREGALVTFPAIAAGDFKGGEIQITGVEVVEADGTKHKLNSVVTKVAETNSVDNISVDNTPAVYYNLQGVRVVNPENGVFVKVQGGKATKVVK